MKSSFQQKKIISELCHAISPARHSKIVFSAGGVSITHQGFIFVAGAFLRSRLCCVPVVYCTYWSGSELWSVIFNPLAYRTSSGSPVENLGKPG